MTILKSLLLLCRRRGPPILHRAGCCAASLLKFAQVEVLCRERASCLIFIRERLRFPYLHSLCDCSLGSGRDGSALLVCLQVQQMGAE